MNKLEVLDAHKVLQLWGATMTFRATSEDHFVGELRAEPGFAPTPHIHHVHEELFYVLEGEFDFLVGDEITRLRAGEFLAVPPGVVHDFFNPGAEPARLLGIATPGGLHRYFEEVESHVANGTFDLGVLEHLRKKYDTEPVHLIWRSDDGASEG